MKSRDRAEMDLVVDKDVKAVLEFMQTTIPTAKLIGVAESLPQLARLLWGHFPQEPYQGASLEASLPTPSISCEKQLDATEFSRGDCADGGSVTEECAQKQ
jgi:hypothetical protein